MSKIINPLCDMPWEIYLDYLADQGFDDLRNVDCNCLIQQDDWFDCDYTDVDPENNSAIGNGEFRERFVRDVSISALMIMRQNGCILFGRDYGCGSRFNFIL